MVDRPDNSRKFLTEFISLYKSMPCLWHINSGEYRDQGAKNKAYELLVQKYREVDETATKATVKNKINALRTTYRKVLSKLIQSIQSSTSDDDVYKPTLWYFHLFDFLHECESRRAHYLDSVDFKQEHEEETKTQGSENNFYAIPSPSALSSQDVPEQHSISSTCSPRSITGRKRKLQYGNEEMGYEEVCYQSNTSQPQREDPNDLFGRHIANKLRSLSEQQHLFAQKLINDVIFEAEMDSLTRGSKIVTESLP